MNIKSKKRFYNKKNKTSKIRKTMHGGDINKIKFKASMITIKMLKDYEQNNDYKDQLYLVQKIDSDEDNEYNDIEEYFGNISSIKKDENDENDENDVYTMIFKCYIYREYKLDRTVYDKGSYTPWKPNLRNYTLPFNDIKNIYLLT
jgi:hypothetical protein